MIANLRIGRKARRGVQGDRSASFPGFKNLDVTSGSMNTLGGVRRGATAFSPMILGPIMMEDVRYTDEDRWKDIGGGVLCYRAEQFWQYLKVYPDLGHLDMNGNVTQAWYDWRDRGFAIDDRKKIATGVTRNMRPAFHYFHGDKLDVISARKRIYVPMYVKLVTRTDMFYTLLDELKRGVKYMLMDVDGPVEAQGIPAQTDIITQKLYDTSSPFGHGYALALALINRMDKPQSIVPVQENISLDTLYARFKRDVARAIQGRRLTVQEIENIMEKIVRQ